MVLVKNRIELILILLPISALLNDILAYEIGPIFVTPYKLVLLFSLGLLLRSGVFVSMKKGARLSRVTIWFVTYCILLLGSVLYSDTLPSLRKLNYLVFFVCEILIVLGVSYDINSIDPRRLLRSLSKVILIIFYSSIVLVIFQIAFGSQILNIGLFSGRTVSYSHTGFNIERLFLCEFLVLGVGLVYFQKKYSKVVRIFLWLGTGYLIIKAGSYTGFLGFLALSIIIIRNALVPLYSLFIGLLLVFLVLIRYGSGINLEDSSLVDAGKFERYITNKSDENWRVISTTKLIDEGIRSPTIIGHGYQSSGEFLRDANYFYTRNLLGVSRASDKEMTSHTFVSALYEQGLLGAVVVIGFLIQLFRMIVKLFKTRVEKDLGDIDILAKFILLLCVLVLLRFLFYYHSINQWYFLEVVMLANILRRKRAGQYFRKRKSLKRGKYESSVVFS